MNKKKELDNYKDRHNKALLLNMYANKGREVMIKMGIMAPILLPLELTIIHVKYGKIYYKQHPEELPEQFKYLLETREQK